LKTALKIQAFLIVTMANGLQGLQDMGMSCHNLYFAKAHSLLLASFWAGLYRECPIIWFQTVEI